MHKLRGRFVSNVSFMRLTSWLIIPILSSVAIGCIDQTALSGPTDISNRYWGVRISHQAIQLSLTPGYDTIRLEAVTYKPDYSPWDTDSSTSHVYTTWKSSDSTVVYIDQSGLATGLKTTGVNGILIMVSRQINGVTLFDTAKVHVSTLVDPPVLKTFQMHPTDSSKRAHSLLPLTLPIITKDTGNLNVIGAPIAFLSLDPDIAVYNNKWVNSLTFKSFQPNRFVTIVASTYLYGVAKSDTFKIEIGAPINWFAGFPDVAQQLRSDNQVQMTLVSTNVPLGIGGILQWQNRSGFGIAGYSGPLLPAADIDVIFDDTTGVHTATIDSGDGNIIGIPSDTTLPVLQRQRYRRFTKAGVYRYTIQPYGLRGSVIVYDR